MLSLCKTIFSFILYSFLSLFLLNLSKDNLKVFILAITATKMRLLVVALVVISSLTTFCYFVETRGNLDKYLEILSENPSRITELTWLVEKVEEDGGESAEETAQMISQLRDKFDSSKSYRLSMILSVFDVKKARHLCQGSEARRYIDIITIAFGSIDIFGSLIVSNLEPKHNVKLFRFLKIYGLKNWRECVKEKKVKDMFYSIVNSVDWKLEQTFDNLMITDRRIPSESELLSAAEKVDFMNGKLDVSHMFNVMDWYYSSSNEKGVERNSKTLIEFLQSICRQLNHNLNNLFDGYNFARFVLPDEPESQFEQSPRFNKFNEYTRLCLQVNSKATSKIVVENIKKNFQN